MQEKIKHIDQFFEGLEFEESSHRYSLNNKPFSISVSGIVNKFVKPFDIYNKSLEIAEREGRCQEDILQEWEYKRNKACELGTNVHLFGEQYTFNKGLKPNNGYEKAIVKFFNVIPEWVIPAKVELKMYHKKYLFAGTCDTLLYNTRTENWIITDYKTNEDLLKNYGGQGLLGCFSDLLENNLNKYQIQLNLYQILFEQTGFKIEERRIIHLLPDGEFMNYKTEDYTDRLQYYLENDFNRN